MVRKRDDESEDQSDDPYYLATLPLVGPTEAAHIFGYSSPNSFKARLPSLPEIRSVELLKGRYYVMKDVFKAAFPEATDEEVRLLILEYRKANVLSRLERVGPIKSQ